MKQLKRGSTIVEVLVAATLIATAILAALSLSSTTQKQTDFSRDLNQATVYNNQALDWLRSMRTTMGWRSFASALDGDTGSSTVTYCLNTLPGNESGFIALSGGACGSGNVITGTYFQREATITFAGNPINRATIIIRTYWADKAHEAMTETTLTEW